MAIQPAGEVTTRKQSRDGAFQAHIEVLRPVNCIFGALTVLIGILNGILPSRLPSLFASQAGWFVVVGGLVVYFFVAGASNLINDIFDVDIDAINRPNRPLPRGAITRAAARRYFLVLCAIATVLSAVVGAFTPNTLLVPLSVAFFLLVGYVYARWGKPSGFPGNLMVGAAFSFGIPFGSFHVSSVTAIPAVIWFFFGTSAFLLISRELVKGMEDMEGDRKFNIKTVANTRGTRAAAAGSVAFSALAIITFTAPAFSLISSVAFIVLMLLGDAAVAASMVLLLKGRDSRKNQKYSSLMLKAGAFLGLVAYVLAPL
ncbi:MAG: geranylgeranylglycerol-phosphate geranylgeranyltransferase [Candidatus Lokiarchaeota archaeon]|nr:geranylgeranylglycerol-phosphate geranylgeranyltransferase [Candidatus Lokiarchaeota archaeon]